MLLSTSATGSDPEWLQSTEKTTPAWSIMLLVTWVSTQNRHVPQTLSAWPKGKPHSSSTEHSPKANPTANLSQERQSCALCSEEGYGTWGYLQNRYQRRFQIVKHGTRLLHPQGLGTTVTALPFSTQGMSKPSSEILLPGHKDRMKSGSGTAQQQLNLGHLRQTKACSSSIISRKDKRWTEQHRSCWGFGPPLSLVLVNALMPRVWGTGNTKIMLVFLPLASPALQKAENQELAGWMPHMGIALQVNE